ncbi:hypothetical protein GWI33_018076 [Rhynchophorus ferrugineus]|uniref:Uncharacterized protein n=1 Tax=Rhynchophorus ferrugineus TaxID=354439 RepID=A0A834I7U0_RHYFE|nr:hypothetical protein GWI33_018076 [Rhynchophorus ferrugineus]
MSPKKPVERLKVLCLKTVTSHLVEAARVCSEKDILSIGKYYEKIPGIIGDDLLLSVLDINPLSSQAKWIIFNALNCCCSKFEARKVSPKYQEKFVEKLTNVLHLNLADARVSSEVISEVIKRCRSLKSLVIPGLATDELLEVISSLNKLEFLDISGNTQVSTESYDYINNQNLQILSIGVPLTRSLTNSSTEDYHILVKLMFQLPNLREIRTYNYTGQAIFTIKPPLVSNLQSISDCFTSRQGLETIIAVCPCLRELTLDDPEPDIFHQLEQLPHLKKLKLRRFCGSLSEVYLKKLTLDVLQVQNVNLDMENICITLHTLSLKHCLLIDSSYKPTMFKNLRVLELVDCDINKEVVLSFFKHCDMLQRFASSSDLDLTDEDLKTVCEMGCLKYLEEFWLSLARNLSSDSVILLMNHCDKLRLVGTLNGWNMEKVDVNYLRCVIYLTNTMLNLIYFCGF